MSAIAPDRQDALEARLQALLDPVVTAAGLELIALRVTPGGGRGVRIQLLIDRLPGEGAVSLDDCVAISRKVNAVLETSDPIGDDYDLEVSSPGMNRILRHEADFRRFAGMTAKVTVAGAGGVGRQSLIGVLGPCENGWLVLQTGKDRDIDIAVAEIQRAALNPTLEEWQALGRKLAAEKAARDPQPEGDEDGAAAAGEAGDGA